MVGGEGFLNASRRRASTSATGPLPSDRPKRPCETRQRRKRNNGTRRNARVYRSCSSVGQVAGPPVHRQLRQSAGESFRTPETRCITQSSGCAPYCHTVCCRWVAVSTHSRSRSIPVGVVAREIRIRRLSRTALSLNICFPSSCVSSRNASACVRNVALCTPVVPLASPVFLTRELGRWKQLFCRSPADFGRRLAAMRVWGYRQFRWPFLPSSQRRRSSARCDRLHTS